MNRRIIILGIVLAGLTGLPLRHVSPQGAVTREVPSLAPAADDCCTLVGDYDGNGLIDFWDYGNILHHLVIGDEAHPASPICPAHMDVNGDCDLEPALEEYQALNDYLYDTPGYPTPQCVTCVTR